MQRLSNGKSKRNVICILFSIQIRVYSTVSTWCAILACLPACLPRITRGCDVILVFKLKIEIVPANRLWSPFIPAWKFITILDWINQLRNSWRTHEECQRFWCNNYLEMHWQHCVSSLVRIQFHCRHRRHSCRWQCVQVGKITVERSVVQQCKNARS